MQMGLTYDARQCAIALILVILTHTGTLHMNYVSVLYLT